MDYELTLGEYEDLVLKLLRQRLMEQQLNLRHEGKIELEDVLLDTSESEHMAVIMFRDSARPQCLFGWRFPAADVTESNGARLRRAQRGPEQAEVWVDAIILTNFTEQIEASDLGLPLECDPDSVTWVGDYLPQ